MLYDIDEKEIMFIAVDIPNQIQNCMEQLGIYKPKTDKMDLAMIDTNQAYHLGVTNALMILQQYLTNNYVDGYMVVNVPGKQIEEEFDIIDFIEKYGKEAE